MNRDEIREAVRKFCEGLYHKGFNVAGTKIPVDLTNLLIEQRKAEREEIVKYVQSLVATNQYSGRDILGLLEYAEEQLESDALGEI